METRKIGEVILDYQYYRPDVHYSDGDIENTLLEASQNDRLQELLTSDSDWAVLYHCSKIRENILDWYPFKKDSSLLEIGAGCGALTGMFSRKVASVTCIELSERRSFINAYRNKNCSNIKIVLGNFQDIEIKEKYDYITLIGVWEYAERYLNGANSYLCMLERLKDYLKPDGKLLIAIENKMGIKYWNGAKEDHTGKMYSGLNDYVDDEGVRTFSHKEIEVMLTAAGYGTYKFYYPVPDYKLPDTIYTDERLPMPGEIRTYREDYSASRIYNFYDAAIEDQICQDGMFSYFSNSFLVECGSLPEDVIYAKYSRNIRKEAYAISTTISKKETDYIVQKRAMTAAAQKHVEAIPAKQVSGPRKLQTANMYLDQGICVTEYIDGQDLDSTLYRYRNDVEMFVREAKKLFETYYKPDPDELTDFVLTDEYRRLFGEVEIKGAKCLKITNIDLILSNLRLTKEGEVYCIDNEWVFEFPIPYGYVVWRAASQLYTKYMIYLKNKISRNAFLEAIGLKKDCFALYAIMEKNFINNVWEEDYKARYRKPTASCKMLFS